MNHGQTKKLMWGLGISDQDAAVIRHAGGNSFSLSCFPVGVTPTIDQLDTEAPCLIWISKEGWDTLQNLPAADIIHLEVPSRILIMGGEYTLQELEALLECGFTEIIKPPITEDRAQEVLRSAIETQNLYQDIMCMTREICLERELLERKNDILSFIVSFLEKVTQHLDPSEILRAAQTELAKLLPVTAVNAICWTPQATETIHASVYVSACEKNSASLTWADMLKEHAQHTIGDRLLTTDMHYVGCSHQDTLPNPENMLALELEHGGDCFGVIMVQCDAQPVLGKDQIQILRSAIQHLTLGLKNAMRYTEAQHNADVDGLTQLYNRRHFDNRLKEEDARHRRYGHSMCLLIADIDNFKRVNDDHGHLIGDTVLRTVGDILMESLRTSDYIARFGGEEFAVILPCTAASHATVLAERIRMEIEAHGFVVENGILNTTASIGVACIDLNRDESPIEMIRRADNALYRAKNEGKNQVQILYPDNSLLVAGGYVS